MSSEKTLFPDEIVEEELTPEVRQALLAALEEVRSLREELKQTLNQLEETKLLADRDQLLHIFNRRAFLREIDRALAMINRYEMRASLIYLDLNGLKQINDESGHAAGDAALKHVGDVLSENIRQADSVGRLGGDEFGVLLLQSDAEQAARKAEELASLIEGVSVNAPQGEFQVSVSWGAIEIDQTQSAEDVLAQADSIMYSAKRKHKK